MQVQFDRGLAGSVSVMDRASAGTSDPTLRKKLGFETYLRLGLETWLQIKCG